MHLRHHGTKDLVVWNNDRASRNFFHKYFFAQTEHIISDFAKFPERWNKNHKCRYSFYTLFIYIHYKVFPRPHFVGHYWVVILVVIIRFVRFSFASMGCPPYLIYNIMDWIDLLLPM